MAIRTVNVTFDIYTSANEDNSGVAFTLTPDPSSRFRILDDSETDSDGDSNLIALTGAVSGDTDASGDLTLTVLSSDSYSPAVPYVLTSSATTMTWNLLLNEDITFEEIIRAGQGHLPDPTAPPGQLGWIPRASSDSAPAAGFRVHGLGDLIVASGMLRVWDANANSGAGDWVSISGGSDGISSVMPSNLEGITGAMADRGKAITVKSDDHTEFALATLPTDVVAAGASGLMTGADKTKLDAIASGAEVNVQSDWEQATNTSDDFIKNKPTIPTVPGAATTSADGLMSSGDKTKLDAIASGAEVNVNADWDSTAGDSEILNKPTVTEVEANPSDAATQTLSKLKVGSTAYNVPSGSGGQTGTAVPPETLTFDNVVLADDETGERFELADAGNAVGTIVTALRSDQDGFTLAAGSYSVNIMAEPTTTSERFYPAIAIHNASTFDATSDTPLAITNGTYFRGNSGHRTASFVGDLYLSAATEVYLFAFQQEADTAPQQVGEAGTLTAPKVTFFPSGGLRGVAGPKPDLSDSDPLVAGTAAAGSSADASRADHVHPKQPVAWNDITAKPAFAPSGAEVNVQSDWGQTTNTEDDYIKNKPTIPSAFSDLTGTVGDSQIPAGITRDSELGEFLPTFPEAGSRDNKSPKFDGDTLGWELDAGAGAGEANVQANWTETDTNSDAFIQNKITAANAIPPKADDTTGATGDSTTEWAREDHKHPKQDVAWDEVTGKPTSRLLPAPTSTAADAGKVAALNTAADGYVLVEQTSGDTTVVAFGVTHLEDVTLGVAAATGPDMSSLNSMVWLAFTYQRTDGEDIKFNTLVQKSDIGADAANPYPLQLQGAGGAHIDIYAASGDMTFGPIDSSSYQTDAATVGVYNVTEGAPSVLSDSDPLVAAAAASSGVSAEVSRADHVHPKQAVAWDDISAKPTFAPAGAEVNVQSDWSQTTNTADDYIKNKPTIPDAVEANPSGAAGAGDLTKLQVGSSIYSIPEGGGGGDGTDAYAQALLREHQRLDAKKNAPTDTWASTQWQTFSSPLVRVGCGSSANVGDYESITWAEGTVACQAVDYIYVEIDSSLDPSLYRIGVTTNALSYQQFSAATAHTFTSNAPSNKRAYRYGLAGQNFTFGIQRFNGTFRLDNASVGLNQLTASGTKDTTTFLRGDNTFAVTTKAPAALVSGMYQQLSGSAALPTLGAWTLLHTFTDAALARVSFMTVQRTITETIKISDMEAVTQSDIDNSDAAGPSYEGTNFRLGLVGNRLYVYNNLRVNAQAPGPFLWETKDIDTSNLPRRIILAPESDDATGVHEFVSVDIITESLLALVDRYSLPVGTEFYTVQYGNNSGGRSRARKWLTTVGGNSPEVLLVSERTATSNLFFYDNTFESTVAENYEVDFDSLDHEASQVYPFYVAFGQSAGTGPDIHTVLAGNFGAAVQRGDYVLLEARGTWPAGVDDGPELSLEDSNGAVISSGQHVLTGENQYFVIPISSVPASATVNLRLSYRKNRDQVGSLIRVWIDGYAVFRQSTIGAVEAAQAAQEWMRPALADRSWRGEYDSTVAYRQYDFVNYTSKIYRANVDNPVGSPRAESSHWTQVSSGTGSAAFTGTWNAAAMYAIGQMVLYDDHLYICSDPSGPTTTTPDGNPNEWDEVSDWHGTWADGPYSPGSIVIHNSLHYLCVSTTQAGDGNPATDTSSWIELDNPEVAAWALIGSSSRIPWSKLPTSGPSFSYNADTVTLVWNSSGLVVLPKSTTSSAGTMSGAQVTKLDGIETGAEVNVKANWSETDTTSDAFIQNKPTLAPSTAEANVQADWDETDSTDDAFILNKPTDFEAHVPHWVRGDYSVGDLVKTGVPPVVFMCQSDRNNTDHANGPNGDPEGWIAVSTHRGDYSDSTYYGVGQTVFHSSKLFICLEVVTPAMNSEPGTSQSDADHWMQLTPPGPADAVPPAADDSSGAVGTSAQFAREDHKHPKQAVAWDDVTGKPSFSGEANVQPDWDETDTADDSYILNKPTIPTIPSNATQSAAGLMGSADKTKLDGIATGAEVNVQSDWDATSGDAQVLNKPTIPTIPAAATTTADGLMSSTDKTHLDSLSGMAVNPRGAWASGTAYVRGDMVYINSNSATYICHTDVPSANQALSPAVDADPDSGTQQFWQYHIQVNLSRQSEGVVRIRMDGSSGPSEGRQVVMGFLHWRSAWTRSAFYVPGAVVKRSGVKYVCGYSHRADASGVDVNGPGTGSSWSLYWDEF